MTQTTVQVRIDMPTKRAAQKTLEAMGLDLSSGMKLFLRNVAITQSIPFQIRTANGFTQEEERHMLQGVDEARKSGKKYHSVEEFMASYR